MSQSSPKRSFPPSSADRHLWEITPVRDMFWIGLVFFVLGVGYYLRGIFIPVLLGMVLAYLFAPLIVYSQEKWNVPRLFTIFMILILLLLLVVGGLIFLGPLIIDQTVTLTHKLPDYVKWVSDRFGLPQDTLMSQLHQLAAHVRENPFNAIQSVLSGTSRAFDFMGNLIGTITYVVGSIMFIPLYFCFFAWHYPVILKYLQEYIPHRHQIRILDILAQMDEAVGGFFRGRLVIAFCMAMLFSIGWYLSEVPYWFLLGVGTGVLSLIPYAATFGWPLAVLMKYLDAITGHGLSSIDWMAVIFWPSFVYAIVQIFEGWVLTPWIQSKSTDLSAFTILLVVLIGGAVGGIYGLILAIPLTACLKILGKEVIVPKIKSWAEME